jgi:hypothetical protein
MRKILMGAGAVIVLLVAIGVSARYYYTYTGQVSSYNILFGGEVRTLAGNFDTYGISAVYRAQATAVTESYFNRFSRWNSNPQLAFSVTYRTPLSAQEFLHYSVETEAAKYTPLIQNYCEGVKPVIVQTHHYTKSLDQYDTLVKTDVFNDQFAFVCVLIESNNPEDELPTNVIFGLFKKAGSFTLGGTGY